MDAVAFAIHMEHDGEMYYRKQARIAQDVGVNKVFQMLAKDEKSHAALLAQWKNRHSYPLIESDIPNKVRNVFYELSNVITFKSTLTQLDVYEAALERERQSIKLYEGMKAGAGNAHEAKVFVYLIDQETHHLAVLDELVRMLRNATDWVESAEFGVRAEY